MNKSFIISYKEDSEERKFNLKILLNWLSYVQDGYTEIIIVEQDTSPKINWLTEIKGNEYIKHIFVKNDGIFNLGWGYNIGAKHANSGVLIFNSVDFIVKHATIKNSVLALNNCDLLKPYKTFISLDKDDTETFVNNNYTLVTNSKNVLITDNSLTGGVFFIKKETFFKLKGFDEDCYGYGYDDDILNEKVKKLNLVYNIVNDTAIHLYHNNAKNGLYYYFTIANKELYNEYVESSKDDIIYRLNSVLCWGDSDISKSNDISIRHIKREIYEEATKKIIEHITNKFTDDYIKELTTEITNTFYNTLAIQIKNKLETDLSDIKFNKNKSFIRKILNKFRL